MISEWAHLALILALPLALMPRVDIRLGRLLRDNLEGIPLDLAARLLPGRRDLPRAMPAPSPSAQTQKPATRT